MRMTYRRKLLLVAILAIFSAPAGAEEKNKIWSGEVELGFVKTGGNTDTQTLNGKGKITQETEKWRNSAAAEAVNIADSGTTTAERYALTGASRHKYTQRAYAFARASYENDRFSGFEYQSTEAVGLGYRLLTGPLVTLDLEGGPGARQSKENQGDSNNEMIALLGGELNWNVSKTALFNQTLTSEIGSKFTSVKSVSSIKTQVIGRLGMKASLTVRHNSSVPAASKKTDTETALTAVYQF